MKPTCNNCIHKKIIGKLGYDYGYICEKNDFEICEGSDSPEDYTCNDFEGNDKFKLEELKKKVNFRRINK